MEQLTADPDGPAADAVKAEGCLLFHDVEPEVGSTQDDDAEAFWTSGEMISSVTAVGHVSGFF